MDPRKVPQAEEELDESGKPIKGIEYYLPKSQYLQPEHRKAVVEDIYKQWIAHSKNSKFHALLATSSIPEAIEYYRLIIFSRWSSAPIAF